MPRPTRRSLLLSLPLASVLAGPAGATGSVTVFAAASLADAVGEIVAAYEAETGVTVRLSAAASSTLARQIEAGAPADIFLSANVAWMDRLEAAGLLAPGTRTPFARNRLVLVAPFDAMPASATPAELLKQATGRIAVGDPDHVPAGLYARTALEGMGLWEGLAPRLARADNTRAALALVARGEAPLGIVYATDAAIAPAVSVVAEIDPVLHPDIVYPGALIAGRDRPEARAVFDHLTGVSGRAVFRAYGFGAP